MKTPLVLALAFLSAMSVSAREFRELTSNDGRKIQAEVLRYENDLLRIRVNGRVFDLKLEQLSSEDQEWVKDWDAAQRGTEEERYYSELIFEDDFSKDGFGERWGHYKSASEVKDGVLIGKTIDINDHAGVDSIRMDGRRDLEVSVKFNFAGPDAKRFNIWLDDKDYKDSHAGHICSIDITPSGGSIADAKTGSFEKGIYARRNSPEGLDEETKEMLKTKRTAFELKLKEETWYHLVVRTKGEQCTVLIDGKKVGEFASEGIAHETKSLVSLTTNINDVHYDDFVVKAAKPAKKEKSGE